LTCATLGAFQKYPWTSRTHQKKFGAYISEKSILDAVAQELGLEQRGEHGWCRHPLAHLVEAADDICYAIIDIEDAVELGIIQFEEAQDVLFKLFDSTERERVKSILEPRSMHRVNFARLRGPVFDRTVAGAIEGYLSAYDKIMEGGYDGAVFDLLNESDPRRTLIKDAKKLGRESIYTDTRKVEIEIGCYATFDALLSEVCDAALNQAQVLGDPSGETQLIWKSAHVLRLLGDHAPSNKNAPPGGGWTPYQCVRRVIDFVCGMTDNYALYIAKQLRGGGFSGGQRP
jgi:dGTPase